MSGSHCCPTNLFSELSWIFTLGTRYEYIPVRSASASMPPTVPGVNIHLNSLSIRHVLLINFFYSLISKCSNRWE